MKRMMMIGICMLMFSGQAMAVQVCKASITASTPTADFIDNGDGTVTHTKTGLMWKQCSEGLSGAACATGTAITYTWQAALQAAQTLNTTGGGFATYTDWRLPNVKELNSIIESQCNGPSINVTVFPAALTANHWSASPSGNAANAWLTDFFTGLDFPQLKSNSYSVRLVRGGQ